MAKYRTYSNYKSTHNKWISLVPNNWDVVPLKYLSSGFVKDGPHETPVFIDEGVPFLSVDGIQNNKLTFDGCRYISHKDHERYSLKCLPNKGDILLGKAASVGKVAYVDKNIEFNVWSPLAVISPKEEAFGKFIYYALRSIPLQAQCDVFSNSNTQKNLGMSVIDNLDFPRPSAKEAEKIANFLDHETAKIDTLIEKQEKLIELLQEKRQAVISHAVTKGLDSSVTMKDSGVEWIGKTPVNWTLTQVKYGYDVTLGKMLQRERRYGDEVLKPYLKAQNIQPDGISLKEVGTMWFSPAECKRLQLKKYDVLLSEGGDVGRAAIWRNELPEAYIQNAINLVRSCKNNTSYFYYWINFLKNSGYIDIAHYTAEKVKDSPLLLPCVKQQIKIASFLDHETAKIDRTIKKQEKMGDLLRERRTALISAAVTGKIDVRNVDLV